MDTSWEAIRQAAITPSKAGLAGLPPGLASTAFPDMNFSGNNAPVCWDGTNSHVFNEAQNTFDVQDNVLWTKGKHNLTFGFQFQALQDNETLLRQSGRLQLSATMKPRSSVPPEP